MIRLARIYRVEGAIMLAIQLQYRAQNALWMLLGVVQPLLSLVVWTTIAGQNGGSVGRYTSGEFAAYFIAFMLVSQATMTWMMFGVAERVRLGNFSTQLLKPVHPIHVDVAENVAFKILSVAIYLPVTVVLAAVYHPLWHLGAETWLAIPSVALGLAIRFVVEWTLGLLGFWVTQMSGLTSMYDVMRLFLTGQIAPLSLFPGPILALATAFPFRWMVYFPVQLSLNTLSARDTLAGFGAQIGWLVVALLGLRLLWAAAVRRHSAVGT